MSVFKINKRRKNRDKQKEKERVNTFETHFQSKLVTSDSILTANNHLSELNKQNKKSFWSFANCGLNPAYLRSIWLRLPIPEYISEKISNPQLQKYILAKNLDLAFKILLTGDSIFFFFVNWGLIGLNFSNFGTFGEAFHL